MRGALLAVSENRWMRERGPKLWFVRKAVRRFMPGEEFDDMLRAAEALNGEGIKVVFTRLGENVTDPAEADFVMRHYVEGLDRIRSLGLPCEPSIKLTQLGLDLDKERCYSNLRTMAERADTTGNYLWIDMEQSSYCDVTLELTRRLRGEFPRVGVCLQAYLHRTNDDLAAIKAEGIGVRMVKGAYKEPPSRAFQAKGDVDANYFRLAAAMLEPGPAGFRAVFGTHDARLIRLIREHADRAGLGPRAFEVHMLYGIQRTEQLRLAQSGADIRVLVAYGSYWFPWYVRRLAERPANVWFVARSLFSR
ncbi:MAG: proline dehydrogenase family protein [Acidobacteriota bacterium]